MIPELMFEPEIPEVLTPVRLQQPLAEVPASVTVITAEQMRLWGVSDLVSAFRFVPGFFVSTELISNSSSVVYHSGEMTLARRLEVLVDGRSVYKASFANVDWDKLNIAVEDVERIEITRGPSAASYGTNALQGVINIITRHPADSEEVSARLEYGSEARRRAYLSSALRGLTAQSRVSVYAAKEGQGGDYHADVGTIGGYPDLNQSLGVNWSGAWQPSADNSLRWQVGRQQQKRDNMADSDFQLNSPLERTLSDMAWLRWSSQRSADHQWQLQGYWQSENTENEFDACLPTLSLDGQMAVLYEMNPELADTLARGTLMLQPGAADDATQLQITQVYQGLALGLIDAQQLSVLLSGLSGDAISVSDEEYQVAQWSIAQAVMADGLAEIACGTANYDLYEERAHIEWQDTRRWNDVLRSVQGIGYREDRINSDTYFGGKLKKTQWMAFSNVEYRMFSDLIWSLSVMAEYIPDEKVRYSPRFGMNYLLSDHQSVRMQVARSRRTPDLAEQYLDARLTLRGLSENYLAAPSADLLYRAQASGSEDSLEDERILAWELGYFHYFSNPSLQLDVKLFRETMTDLISTSITLSDVEIVNNGTLTLTGIEGQMSWQPVQGQSLLLGWLLQDREFDAENEMALGAETSLKASWTRNTGSTEQMLAAFWDRSRYLKSGDAAQGHYGQKRISGRTAFNTDLGTLSLTAVYNALAERVLYERDPRWLVKAGWSVDW